jgi:hypothetical protein
MGTVIPRGATVGRNNVVGVSGVVPDAEPRKARWKV